MKCLKTVFVAKSRVVGIAKIAKLSANGRECVNEEAMYAEE